MLRAIELARDEPSVPSQNGIRQSGSRYIAECLAAQSTTNLAEPRSLGVRELRPTLQLTSQDLVLSGEIFISQQQLLVQRPADVGQDACPLHELPHLPAGSQWPPLIAPNNVTDNARRAHAECYKLPNLSCSANFLAIRAELTNIECRFGGLYWAVDEVVVGGRPEVGARTIQCPTACKYQGSYPRRNGSPRNCCSRVYDG